MQHLYMTITFYTWFKVISYDYSQWYSHLKYLVIDFLVAKNKISFSENNQWHVIKKFLNLR